MKLLERQARQKMKENANTTERKSIRSSLVTSLQDAVKSNMTGPGETATATVDDAGMTVAT